MNSPRADERRVEGDAGGGEGVGGAGDALAGDVEVGGRLGLGAEDADALVAEADEVVDRPAARSPGCRCTTDGKSADLLADRHHAEAAGASAR